MFHHKLNPPIHLATGNLVIKIYGTLPSEQLGAGEPTEALDEDRL
jgi:hypothetical protein